MTAKGGEIPGEQALDVGNSGAQGCKMIQARSQNFMRMSRIFPVFGLVFLAACEGGINLPTLQAPTPEGTATETIETDVAAPEAFSISDTALWDGRPTFGGVWVAYPDVDQPERVRITNPDNGKTVIGALYKRSRDFPGPKIELSADAASALGVLAGNPTELNIVALRRKTVEVAVEAPADPLAPPPDIPVPLRRPQAAPKPAPEPAPKPTPVPVPPAATTVPAVTASPLPPVSGDKPAAAADGLFIQVATLQSKSRAQKVKQQLEKAGLLVEIREKTTGSRTLYRVIVGPAAAGDAFKLMMETVHELGYKDAIKLG